ncbi:sigma-70 family RNA polymerase sigma factor [Terrabacter sp. NPDC080008]|uniref:RNA polymerase sigma factor n=1 Tax=Terrabacter sp. NPDC080008 TaxID=3155176 RepID=UPI00344E4B55
MRANRTPASRPRPVPAPGKAPARGRLARAALHLPALVPATATAHVAAGGGVPAYGPVLPGPPTWRSALDALWASLADEGFGGVELARTGAGGPGPRPLEQESDAQRRVAALVHLAQQGDKEAFAQLYDLYVDTIFRYVLVRVANRALAEDLTSETFIRAMRRIDSFTWQGKDIAAWFVTIARNLIADHVKSARFRFEVATADMRDADERVDAPDTEVLTRLRDERLVAAIKQLGPDQAECITLRFLQGLSLADTARVLGKSEGAVKQLQLRATRALRKLLDGVEL